MNDPRRQARDLMKSIVPAATLRQANCYYSSSDAAFADRYQAGAEYERVRPYLDYVQLPLGVMLHETSGRSSFAYFPTAGIVSREPARAT